LLKKKGLDDETLALKYRITKRDAPQIRREIEFWFGKKPEVNEKVVKPKTKVERR